MILLPEWLHMLNYVQTFFSYPSTPPPLSNLLKSTCSTCSAFKIFQNIQNCNQHQSAQDAQAPKVFFSQVFISGFWHSVQTCARNSLYGFLWPHINSKISEPQNIDHTTQSGLHTFWLVLAMVFGEMNFVIWCCMLSHFLKKVFLQCRCYQGWFQYPSSWKPQAQLEKNGTLLLLFEAQ